MFRRILGVVVVVPTSAAPVVDVLLVLELDELEESELGASGASMFFPQTGSADLSTLQNFS